MVGVARVVGVVSVKLGRAGGNVRDDSITHLMILDLPGVLVTMVQVHIHRHRLLSSKW